MSAAEPGRGQEAGAGSSQAPEAAPHSRADEAEDAFERLFAQLETPAVEGSGHQPPPGEASGVFATPPRGEVEAPTQNTQPGPAPAEPAGEFTRIFTQLPTPRSAPPAILAGVARPAPAATPPAEAPGEFTQFFQALTPGSPSSFRSPVDSDRQEAQRPPQPVAAPSAPAALSQPPVAPSAGTSNADTFRPFQAGREAAPSATQAFAAIPATVQSNSASERTSQASQIIPEPLHTANEPLRAPEPVAQPAAAPGDFTAFFQALAPGSRGQGLAQHEAGSADPAGRSVSPPFAEAKPTAFSPQASTPSRDAEFPRGFADPAPPRPAAAGGFTELMQSLGNEQPRASLDSQFAPAAPHASAGPAPAANAFSAGQASAHSSFAPPAQPAFSQKSSPPDAAAPRPGEFTELMQSLQPSGGKARDAVAPQQPAAAPFFQGNPGSLAAGGPSEYTRILQGSAARSAGDAVPTFAPQSAAPPAAVGLPIAAVPKPAAPALPEPAGKTRLQAMMPWLLAANGLLLLLLIVLALLFLRHHH